MEGFATAAHVVDTHNHRPNFKCSNHTRDRRTPTSTGGANRAMHGPRNPLFSEVRLSRTGRIPIRFCLKISHARRSEIVSCRTVWRHDLTDRPPTTPRSARRHFRVRCTSFRVADKTLEKSHRCRSEAFIWFSITVRTAHFSDSPPHEIPKLARRARSCVGGGARLE